MCFYEVFVFYSALRETYEGHVEKIDERYDDDDDDDEDEDDFFIFLWAWYLLVEVLPQRISINKDF